MKKFIYCLIMALTITLGLTSCSDKTEKAQDRLATIKAAQKSVENPEFTDKQSFVRYVMDVNKRQRFEEIVSKLSVSQLAEMTDVIINREGKVTWESFLEEYDDSYETVYKYLNRPDPSYNGNIPKKESDTLLNIKSGNNNLNVIQDERTTTANGSSSVQRQ